MTYQDLYEKAIRLLDNSEITIGEYEEMIKPLKPEICEWIPCSERLPESGSGLHYLVTLKDVHCLKDDVYEAFFDKNGWYIDCLELAYDDVIAWQPLPKPYREEKQNG